jgi:exosortase/archaeosortase family protein
VWPQGEWLSASRPDRGSGVRLEAGGHHKPILRFAVVYCSFLAGFQALFLLWIARSSAFRGYLEILSQLTAAVLGVAGYEVDRSGASLFVESHPIKVVAGCDGLQPAAFLVGAIAASPAPARRKLLGATIGVTAVLLLNLVRVLSLIITSVEAPSILETLHQSIWPMAIMLFALAFWVSWAFQAIPASRWATP